jgi:hypothetical protein
MNNIVILLAALATLFIGFVQCCNSEDMALFFLACFICVPAILISIVGIVMDKNFFEM